MPRGTYNHEFKWGLDYKETNVNLVLGAIPILGDQAVVTQCMLGYDGSLENPIADLSFSFKWFISPGDIFRGQGTSEYESLRPLAKSRYTYLRVALNPLFHLPASFDVCRKISRADRKS